MLDKHNKSNIPKGWKETTFEEIAEPSKSQWKPGDKKQKYIGLEHINQGDLSINGFGYSSSLESNKFYFDKGDVLFGKLRPYFRKVWKAQFNGICSTDIWVLKCKKDFDQYFLFYFVANPIFVNRSMGANIGTHMPRADWQFLKNTDWIVPLLPEQRAIAAVLSSFDYKIELLRAQNKTLEKMAQTLFKHWFIDFEFPDQNGKPYKSSGGKMIDSELGEIPDGWSVAKIKDFGAIICGKTPPKGILDYFGGHIPFIKIPDMHDELYIIKTEDSLSEAGANFQKNKFIPKNSICVSCIATVGLVSITSRHSQTNQQINSIVPADDYCGEYLYFSMIKMKHDLFAMGSGGSTTLNINTGVFSNIKIIHPQKDSLKTFHAIAKPIFDKVLSNLTEIQTLSKIRDTILPKLMRGEIRAVESRG